MDLELHQLERRYEALRTRNAARERRLLGSIAEIGQQTPIVVVRDVARFVVIDGYKRLRALVRLGQDTVAAVEWALAEVEALLFERILRAGDADSPIEQGWFLRELVARFGLGLDVLARRLDRSKSWVSRRIALVSELPATVQDRACRRTGRGSHGRPRAPRRRPCSASRDPVRASSHGSRGRTWRRSGRTCRGSPSSQPELLPDRVDLRLHLGRHLQDGGPLAQVPLLLPLAGPVDADLPAERERVGRVVEDVGRADGEVEVALRVDVGADAPDDLANVLHVHVVVHDDADLREHELAEPPQRVRHLRTVARVLLLDRD